MKCIRLQLSEIIFKILRIKRKSKCLQLGCGEFQVGTVVYFKEPEYMMDGAEVAGFTVLLSFPDSDNCIPVKRNSDGQYFCLCVSDLQRNPIWFS